MPAVSIDIKMLADEILDSIHEVTTVVIPQETEDAFEDILQATMQELRVYPPETEANQPPPPYYERGVGNYGWFGTVTKVSEDLKSQWRHEVTVSGNTVTGKLSNIASYAKRVHNEQGGDALPPYQARFHAKRGWPTAQAAVRRAAGMETESSIGKRIQQIVDKVVGIFRR